MNDISVNTQNAKSPKLTTAQKPFHVNKTTTKIISAGKGATVSASDTVLVNYVAINGKDDKQLVNTFSQTPVVIPLADSSQFKGLVTALKGAKVGTKEVVAIPPSEGFGADGSSQLGITNQDTLVFYVDIQSVVPKEASGTTEKPKSGFPTVSVAKDNTKPATITIPKGLKAPTKTESETLIKGKGAAVKTGQTVTVAYTGALFNGGTVFDASAKRGYPASFQLDTQNMIKGFVTGLTGQTVGSRVVIMMPASDAYGSTGQTQAGIPANAPLVFVVDILAAS